MTAKKTTRATDNGRARSRAAFPAPEWKASLNAYPEKQWLRFASKEDLHAAIDLLWTAAFRTLPHCTPDGRSLVVPEEAVEPLARAGLQFTATRLRSITDLTPSEIRKLRG
jgi:hypothetical protein